MHLLIKIVGSSKEDITVMNADFLPQKNQIINLEALTYRVRDISHDLKKTKDTDYSILAIVHIEQVYENEDI